jgi:hypothetical protein
LLLDKSQIDISWLGDIPVALVDGFGGGKADG